MKNIDYGLVKIIGGHHKGKIGLYDDDDDYDTKGIVYFGDPLINQESYEIKYGHIDNITTDDLFIRMNELYRIVNSDDSLRKSKAYKLLSEYYFVNHQLSERLLEAKLSPQIETSKIFLSHSSKDKEFVRWLNIDLRNLGHNTWLDEWEIKVGDSIPKKISKGLENCDFVVVVLSEDSVKSNWVENEWQSKYWDEIQEEEVKILPVLLNKCKIPMLLKNKKYADFTKGYSKGFKDLIISL